MAKSSDDKTITLKKMKFLVGNVVYLITDLEQLPRVVTAVHLRTAGYVYELRYCTDEPSTHFEVEISEEMDKDMKNRYLINPSEQGDEDDDDEDIDK